MPFLVFIIDNLLLESLIVTLFLFYYCRSKNIYHFVNGSLLLALLAAKAMNYNKPISAIFAIAVLVWAFNKVQETKARKYDIEKVQNDSIAISRDVGLWVYAIAIVLNFIVYLVQEWLKKQQF